LAGIEPPVKVTVEVPVLTVPPQVLLAVPETTTPTGSVSISGALRLAAVEFVLLKVMVSVELPPALIVAGLNSLPRATGDGEETVKVAIAGEVLLPLLVCKAPTASESMKLPPVEAMTGTVIVQEPLAGIEPPVNVTDEEVLVTVPPQVELAALEIVRPLGNVSVNGAVKLAAVALLLLKVMVRVELPPASTVAGLNALPNVGETTAALTVRVARAGAALLPLLVCKEPAFRELMKLPPLGAVTGTVTVQEPLAGIEPPVNVTDEAVIVTVPPQVLVAVPLTVTPLGNASTNGAVRVAAVALVLLKVIVRVEAPPALITAGLNALPSVGGTAGMLTVKVAIAGAILLPLLVSKAPISRELT
jgi:hypothetical protein